jgi:F420-non-reducing hydrogenase iron-sulfur subunit
MRLIRVMCSGRVDLAFVLRAFLKGADGVFIGGCRLNECNYTTHGNYHALSMVLLGKKILAHLGLNPERLRVEFMSAGEGILFAEVMNDFSTTLKALGPLGKSEGLDAADLRSKIQEASRLVPYIKMAKGDKLGRHLDNPEAYDKFFTAEEVDALFRDVVSYHIAPDKCQACMICLKKCPVDAIVGARNQIHIIDQEKCIKCGTCYDACPSRFGAVQKIFGECAPPPIPEAERMLVRKSKEKAGAL